MDVSPLGPRCGPAGVSENVLGVVDGVAVGEPLDALVCVTANVDAINSRAQAGVFQRSAFARVKT